MMTEKSWTKQPESIWLCLKPLFHSSQKPTRKLAAARTFIQSQYLKALAVSLRVGFCNEWKRGLIIRIFSKLKNINYSPTKKLLQKKQAVLFYNIVK